MTKKTIATTLFALVVLACSTLHAFAMKPQAQQSRAPLKLSNGQSATLLPDGRWLFIGGADGQGEVSSSITIFDPVSQVADKLAVELRTGRMGHSATLLPNGKVLIFGGVDGKGGLVTLAEIFDPEFGTLEFQNTAGLRSRAFHTATLLTDGRVLIGGGIGSGQKELDTIEVWDPRTEKAKLVSARLGKARQKQTATLLSNGAVMFWGGTAGDVDLAGGEVFDLASETVKPITARIMPSDAEAPAMNFSSPADGEVNVSLKAVIAVRFSQPISVTTFDNRAVTLRGAEGVISVKVVPAEEGALAFVTPSTPLAEGSAYQFSFNGVLDAAGRPLPFTEVSFKTAGEQPSVEDWLPDANGGDWKTHRARSPWQDLPPLQAAAGVTAISGQILKLDGKPLANVTLSINGSKTSSDSTGRFLLQGVSPGHAVLLIDGSTASQAKRNYGLYEDGVDIKAAKTNVLPYVIWMTALDMAHAVNIPSPTTTETVISSPLLPGLELHLPAGTTITDHDGRVVKQISITPIPVDRPPFPLPIGVYVPIYFTIQPGSAYIKTPYHSGARLIYPNFTRLVPRSPVDFWNYDPEEKGWYVYGKGSVSSDAQQVIPDVGVSIYEFTGAMIGGTPFPSGPLPGDGGGGGGPTPPIGDPIDPNSGLFLYSKTDLFIPDVIPINITRSYRQSDPTTRAFGIGTNFRYEMFLTSSNNYHDADLVFADGSHIHYVCNNPTGCLDSNTQYTHDSTPTMFYKSTLVYSTDSAWDLTLQDGTVYRFGDLGPLQWIKDRYGNKLRICRAQNGSCERGYGNITQIISPNGKWVKFTYDPSNRITQIVDNIGRTVGYTYDAAGNLWKATDVSNGTTEYTYSAAHQMLTIKDPRNVISVTNEYDANGRVKVQTLPGNNKFQMTYTLDANGKVVQTDSTDPRGNVRRTLFDTDGYTIRDTFALGTTDEHIFAYDRDPNTRALLNVTDPLSRQTHYSYDSNGNIKTLTEMNNTAAASTTTLDYDPVFGKVTIVKDPLNHSFRLSYDAKGNLIGIKDALQHEATFVFNGLGQMTSMSDPLGNVTSLQYDGSDLTRVVDSLGNTVTKSYDGVSRIISVTNAKGDTTRFNYTPGNQISTVIDPLGGVTSFTYDANGNLLSFQDPRQQGTQNKTTYTYDDMNRLQTRTDPLWRQESYQYDEVGNLVQFTDRRGKISLFNYDAVNRRVFAGYGATLGSPNTYESTITYQYDAANRLVQATDSQGGSIARQFNDVARTVAETTPQGVITSTYDAAGRRTNVTISGQPSYSYNYDDADRLTQISQASSVVGFSYDNSNRRTGMTLPNGVSVSYAYDVGSRLIGINYQLGVTPLGNITYGYDGSNRRTQVGGTLARTGLPQAVTSAVYDLANQLTEWNGSTLTYDANGNLTSDGINAYSWNARNRLVSVGGTTFGYDAMARRTRTGIGIDLLYDGPNVVQELAGSSSVATRITRNIDEAFSRTDSAGTLTALVDGAGSTVSLVDAAGTPQVQYTYEPFGNTTISGGSSNSYAYTGRELEASGLYYYRSRYYSPRLHRFVSEDPVGLLGGINYYTYALDDPVNRIDPFGSSGVLVHLVVTYDAYRITGHGIWDSFGSAVDVVAVDFFPHSQDPDAAHSNEHYMAGKKNQKGDYQSCEEANQGALDTFAHNGGVGSPYANLHLIQDSRSRSHGPDKQWRPGPFGLPTWEHFKADWVQDESIVDAARSASVDYLKDLNSDPLHTNTNPTKYLPSNACDLNHPKSPGSGGGQ